MTDVLGKLSFLDIPTVNALDVLLNHGGVPALLADVTANRPAAGAGPLGRIFLDTSLSRFYRDDGAVWVDLTSVPLIDGTANQVDVVDGTNVTPAIISIASNPILPGTGSFRPPVGTTAQRPGSPGAGDSRYNTTLGMLEVFNGTFWHPLGAVLQSVTGTIAATSSNSQVPFDNTTPTSSEGMQIFTTNFTPISATSTIIVRFAVTVSHGNSARTITASMFAGTTNIGAASTYAASANAPYSLSMHHTHQLGSTATVTLSARVGASGSGTCYVNQTSGVTLGGALVSEYCIVEIA